MKDLGSQTDMPSPESSTPTAVAIRTAEAGSHTDEGISTASEILFCVTQNEDGSSRVAFPRHQNTGIRSTCETRSVGTQDNPRFSIGLAPIGRNSAEVPVIKILSDRRTHVLSDQIGQGVPVSISWQKARPADYVGPAESVLLQRFDSHEFCPITGADHARARTDTPALPGTLHDDRAA